MNSAHLSPTALPADLQCVDCFPGSVRFESSDQSLHLSVLVKWNFTAYVIVEQLASVSELDSDELREHEMRLLFTVWQMWLQEQWLVLASASSGVFDSP